MTAASAVVTAVASTLDLASSGTKALVSATQSAVAFPVVEHLAVFIFFLSAATASEEILAAALALTRAALSSAKVGAVFLASAALVAAAFLAAAAAAFLAAAAATFSFLAHLALLSASARSLTPAATHAVSCLICLVSVTTSASSSVLTLIAVAV